MSLQEALAWEGYKDMTVLNHPKNGAPHTQVLRLPMQHPSYEGYFLAKDGSGGVANSRSCNTHPRSHHMLLNSMFSNCEPF